MDALNQISSDWSHASTMVKAVMVVVGCLVLFVALKAGGLILKLLFGLAGLALIAGAIWWFFFRH